MKKLIIMIMCLTLIVGCGKKETTEVKEEPEKVQISVELEDVEVEVNGEVTNTQGVINVFNGEIVSQEEKVDTSVLGEKIITIIAKDLDGEEKEFSYKVKVVDTTPPVITYKESLSTTVGTKIDLLKNVSAKDNSGEKIKVTVEGKYDFDKTGTYKLKYVAKDSSGNETIKDFTLTVKEKPVPKDPEPTKPSSGTTSTSSGYNPNGTDASLNGTKTSKGYTITVKGGITYIDGIMIANKTYSLPKSYAPGGLTSATNKAANEMIAAAKKDGVSLYVASGYRSWTTQNNLWQKRAKNYGKEFADSGTARGGYSEHQTGLAFDMCGSGSGCISSEYHNSKGAKWMAANAYKYGLILRYPQGKESITGYKYESWHFRYVGVELATKLYNNGNWITLEEYFGITSKYAD